MSNINSHKYDNHSINFNSQNTNQDKKHIKSPLLKISHRILDSLYFSIIILIFILSFRSFKSQKDWTNIYALLTNTRNMNNSLIDYISKTEEFYIKEFDQLVDLKKTTSKDLIYLTKQTKKNKHRNFQSYYQNILSGISDSSYQRGY